jgi:hypothetical protein
MAYQISWYMPNHVLLTVLRGGISAAEVQMVSDEMYEMLASVTGTEPIALLIDARQCHMDNKIWEYAQLKFKVHGRRGRVIVIGEASLLGLVVSLLARATNFHVQFTATVEEAINKLATWDARVASYVAQQKTSLLD